MNIRIVKVCCAIVAAWCGLISSPLYAQSIGGTVAPGYDLFTTAPGTYFTFMGMQMDMTGVPLGTYNFGGSIGVQNVGNTDTIVQRLGTADFMSNTTVSTQLVALDLQSVAPVSGGPAAGHFIFVTLQSTDNTGPASTGQMTINFPSGATTSNGTFTSFFDVFFDVHLDSPNGPIVNNGQLHLSNSGANWMHDPVSGELLIDGVNNNLNGMNRNADFHTPFVSEMEMGAVHNVQPTLAEIPEPSTWVGGALALSAMLVSQRRRLLRTLLFNRR
jgi:hypothetical protein